MAPGAGVAAAQDFDPMVDGFSFQNYTNEASPVNLTGAELHRMFGDAVCSSGSGPTCPLTPQADQWMETTSDGMGGGHCEGMAVLSLRLWLGDDDAVNYDPGAMGAFTLAFDNEALQREIGYWFSLQSLEPVPGAAVRGAPSVIVETLRAALAGSGEAYTLGFYQRDRTGGHAVTPFAVNDVDATHVEIVIYDNNFPGEARVIEVDTEAETWSYSAAASPDVPESLYEGDATTDTLELNSMSSRTGTLTCPFCGNYQGGAPATRTVAVTGDASLLIQDAAGNQLGHLADGTLVNDIPGADVITERSDDLWADRDEPTYTIPGGLTFDVFIADGGDAFAEPSDLSVTGPGYYLGVENIALDPGQMDVAYFDADFAHVGYETSGMETPDIVLATQTSVADWVFVLRSRGDSAGQAIDALVDFDAGVLQAVFDGADAESEFDLFIARVDAGTELEFANQMVRVPNGAILSVFFGEFDLDGETLTLSIDVDGDGAEDSMLALADSGDGGIGPGPGATPPPPPPTPPGGSGGCSAGLGHAASTGWSGLGLLVLLAARSRRRVR